MVLIPCRSLQFTGWPMDRHSFAFLLNVFAMKHLANGSLVWNNFLKLMSRPLCAGLSNRCVAQFVFWTSWGTHLLLTHRVNKMTCRSRRSPQNKSLQKKMKWQEGVLKSIEREKKTVRRQLQQTHQQPHERQSQLAVDQGRPCCARPAADPPPTM